MMFVSVLRSAFIIRILFPDLISEPFLFNELIDFAVLEVSLEMGIFERVVVGQWYFVDVVCMDKFFLRTQSTSCSPHNSENKINIQ